MPGSDLWRLRHLAGRVQEVYGSEGVEGVVRRTRLWMSRRRALKGAEGLPDGPVAASASHWPVSVLSVAEHSIPQCYHYRVEQKAQIFEDLGVPFATVGLEDPLEAISRLQLASVLRIMPEPRAPADAAKFAACKRIWFPYPLSGATSRISASVTDPVVVMSFIATTRVSAERSPD